MAATLRSLVLGDALSPASRARLTDWLVGCKTGDARLRAGVPAGWRVGDKTGGGERGATNDIAVLWPPGEHRSWFLHTSPSSAAPPERRNAALAAVGRAVAQTPSRHDGRPRGRQHGREMVGPHRRIPALRHDGKERRRTCARMLPKEPATSPESCAMPCCEKCRKRLFSDAFRLDTRGCHRYTRATFSAGGELRQSVRHPRSVEFLKASSFGLHLAPRHQPRRMKLKRCL